MQSTDERPIDELARYRATPIDAREHLLLQWKMRALRAVKEGRPRQAWLWADALCRHLGGMARTDALMLRSVAFALQGDAAAAEDDLSKASQIDPWSPAVNRALLNSGKAATRVAAAQRLLRGDKDEDCECGINALAREGVDCVGLMAQSNNRLSGRILWNGRRSITLLAQSDVHEQSILVHGEAAKGAFKWTGCIDAPLPHQARVVTLQGSKLKALFDPPSLLLPAADAPKVHNPAPRTDRLMIVVPVYDGREVTKACLESLFSVLPSSPSCRIVVVDDASSDKALCADLDALARADRIVLIRNRLNMGFAASVNRALEKREGGDDVLLLNADAVVPAGAIEALAAHIRRSPDIGTATPLSNSGEDTSFPVRFGMNKLPSPAVIAELQKTAASANRGLAIDMPNGVGFCLYINGAAIDRLSGLSTAFDRGYYEDVEFCLRVKQAGFRNVCAADAYVGHHGSQSFGAKKRALVVQNLRRLSQTHPDYIATARAFEKADPLKPVIARVEDELLCRTRQHLVLIPADAPQFVKESIAWIVARKHENVLVAHAGERKGALHLLLTAAGGASPQNVIWRFAMAGGAELVNQLSRLCLTSATIIDADAIPPALTEAVARRVPDITLVAARLVPVKRAPKRRAANTTVLPKGINKPATLALTPMIRDGFATSGNAMDLLDLSGLPHTKTPALAASTGVLAVLGASERDEDIALLRALGASLPATSNMPTVIVASQIRTRLRLPANVHVAGHVGDDEMPAWLSRLEAQAVLFADRKWAMADPRAALWQAAGLPVAWFGSRAVDAPQHCTLVLSGSAGADMLAEKIATWMAGVRRGGAPSPTG